MSHSLSFAALVLLLAAAPLGAQRTTERFIPIGMSPGVSGISSVIGTVEAVDRAAKTVRVVGPDGAVTIQYSDTTEIWIDRSARGETALVGSYEDLAVGRTVEIKFIDPRRRDHCDWIKVAAPGPSG